MIRLCADIHCLCSCCWRSIPQKDIYHLGVCSLSLSFALCLFAGWCWLCAGNLTVTSAGHICRTRLDKKEQGRKKEQQGTARKNKEGKGKKRKDKEGQGSRYLVIKHNRRWLELLLLWPGKEYIVLHTEVLPCSIDRGPQKALPFKLDLFIAPNSNLPLTPPTFFHQTHCSHSTLVTPPLSLHPCHSTQLALRNSLHPIHSTQCIAPDPHLHRTGSLPTPSLQLHLCIRFALAAIAFPFLPPCPLSFGSLPLGPPACFIWGLIDPGVEAEAKHRLDRPMTWSADFWRIIAWLWQDKPVIRSRDANQPGSLLHVTLRLPPCPCSKWHVAVFFLGHAVTLT